MKTFNRSQKQVIGLLLLLLSSICIVGGTLVARTSQNPEVAEVASGVSFVATLFLGSWGICFGLIGIIFLILLIIGVRFIFKKPS